MQLLFLLKKNRIFFTGFFLFFILCCFILIVYPKAEGFFLLNTYHSTLLTSFFIYATYLGDGFFCIATGILLFYKRGSLALMVLISYAVSGIVAQVLKYFIVEPRPAVLLKYSGYPYFIDDVTLHNFHAFPSGHTASAFALAAVLSFSLQHKGYSIFLLAGAILVGYSRIYLAQHFMDDVLAGAIIGVISAIICQLLFQEKFSRIKFKRNKTEKN